MATTTYLEELIRDQGGQKEMSVQFGRSSFHPEDSSYLTVEGMQVIMDRAAQRFVEAMVSLGHYHRLIS